ncbi:MAG: hydrogenase maturation nickel metallochaperone HypA [Clostridiales bacterium]|jgi:hydrogenase nickel incorporation protein HypA/HybF|nr:hydrogenase maturation nickel metallochaperone HypA [Eubacteriales bacterium]MDH7567548.1 hydrogenase maturation nickel metallochaperone HypA [Clostridiales bacterium]
MFSRPKLQERKKRQVNGVRGHTKLEVRCGKKVCPLTYQKGTYLGKDDLRKPKGVSPLPWRISMHEYAVTKSIIDTVTKEAEQINANRITVITLAIGDLSTILDESVQMYFDIISEGTLAEGAKLVFKRIPAMFRCRSCGKEFPKPGRGFDCPECGNLGYPTGAGKEFYIESIEVE